MAKGFAPVTTVAIPRNFGSLALTLFLSFLLIFRKREVIDANRSNRFVEIVVVTYYKFTIILIKQIKLSLLLQTSLVCLDYKT